MAQEHLSPKARIAAAAGILLGLGGITVSLIVPSDAAPIIGVIAGVCGLIGALLVLRVIRSVKLTLPPDLQKAPFPGRPVLTTGSVVFIASLMLLGGAYDVVVSGVRVGIVAALGVAVGFAIILYAGFRKV